MPKLKEFENTQRRLAKAKDLAARVAIGKTQVEELKTPSVDGESRPKVTEL